MNNNKKPISNRYGSTNQRRTQNPIQGANVPRAELQAHSMATE